MGSELILLLALVIGLIWIMYSWAKPEPELFCPACGHIGEAKTVIAGSGWIELILWLLSIALALVYFWAFIFVGPIYSLWAYSNKRNACKSCGAGGLIPPDSPMAKKIIQEIGGGPQPPPPADHRNA